MVSVEHNPIAKCWEVKYKGVLIRRAETRVQALRIAFKICELMIEEEIE